MLQRECKESEKAEALAGELKEREQCPELGVCRLYRCLASKTHYATSPGLLDLAQGLAAAPVSSGACAVLIQGTSVASLV